MRTSATSSGRSSRCSARAGHGRWRTHRTAPTPGRTGTARPDASGGRRPPGGPAADAAAAASAPRPALPPLPTGEAERKAAADAVWARVQRARDPKRPHTLELLDGITDRFVELKGDRFFADDEALIGGLARIGEMRLVVLGHQKGAETDENIRRNFGMPHPEGYRKAMRLMKLAERFGMPVVTFVDTPGAYPGTGSEERGVAEAIAKSVALMTRLRTPIVVVITGEGGSGGALAIAVGDVVVALENAVYSVISPEGCASILWRTPEMSQVAALAMRMSAEDQKTLGVVDLHRPRARRRRPGRSPRPWPRPSATSSRGSSTASRSSRWASWATCATPATVPSARWPRWTSRPRRRARPSIPARIRELRGIIAARRAESARARAKVETQ